MYTPPCCHDFLVMFSSKVLLKLSSDLEIFEYVNSCYHFLRATRSDEGQGGGYRDKVQRPGKACHNAPIYVVYFQELAQHQVQERKERNIICGLDIQQTHLAKLNKPLLYQRQSPRSLGFQEAGQL